MAEEMVKIYRRDDGAILIIRGYYPCPHRNKYGNKVRHVHYCLTSEKELKKLGISLKALIEWLEYGFWSDSGSESELPLIRKFYARQCFCTLL